MEIREKHPRIKDQDDQHQKQAGCQTLFEEYEPACAKQPEDRQDAAEDYHGFLESSHLVNPSMSRYIGSITPNVKKPAKSPAVQMIKKGGSTLLSKTART